jgi:spermidine/putrescine-binding protein
MAEESDNRGSFRLPTELTRHDLLKYGLLAGSTFFIGACGSDEKAATSTAKVANPVPKKKPDQLIVRTWGDPWRKFWDENAAKAFTAETGIPVKWDTTDTGELMTKIRAAIGAGQRPPVDAAMSDSVQGYLANVQKLSVPLDPKVATALAAQNQDIIKPGFKIPDFAMAGMYSFSVPLIYRKDKVKNAEEALSSWANLATEFPKKSVALTTGYQWMSFPRRAWTASSRTTRSSSRTSSGC